jgi:acyl carrier protein
MDFLNLVIMIHKTFGVEIPESDYPKYGTLNGCVEQLSDKRVI